MSEKTSENQTGGPACEGESFIVEVIGEQHPEGHEFRIYDETDQQQQEWLVGQAKEENLGSSVLHIWPWKAQPTRNIWLDIESEDGEPVRVPLFSKVASTPRQMGKQWNRILPLVPLTLIHDPEPDPGHPRENPVPVRPGFIYIFREGQLWRELEVRHTDSGTMEFMDVRLTDYRKNGEAGLAEDRREVVGKPQSAIWVPVSGMNRSLLSSIEMAFSEVQWSADRVAYLEQSATARADRCQKLKGPEPVPDVPSLLNDREMPGRLISLVKLPEMRTRESYLEQHLPRPWKSIYDLKGQYAKNLYDQAREEVQAFDAGKESGEEAWETAHYRDAPLKRATAARAAAFTDEASNGEENPLWRALDTSEDSLATPREQGYAGIILEDTLFRIRHHITQALEAQRYFVSVLEAVQKAPNSDSAQLVQAVMGPERLGGRENPLHQYLENIDTSRFGALHSELRTAQRQLAREELALAQKQVADLMRQPPYQTAMADLFSLSGADYLEGFAVCQDLFQTLSQDPNTMDPLTDVAVTNSDQVRDANNLLLGIIEEGSDQPLHRMLFPDDQALAGESGPDEAEGCGDGRCRPADLEQLSREVPEEQDLQTLSAFMFAGIAADNKLDLSSELKRWAALVNAVLDGVDKHARGLMNRLKSQAFKLNARFYGPLLRMAKAREPGLMGSVQIVARNAVPQGWFILGLEDPEIGLRMGLTEADREYVHKANGHKRYYGKFYDSEGKMLASTRKSEVPDLAETAEARNTYVYAVPENSETVKVHRDMRRMENWGEFFDRIRVPYLVLVLEAHNVWREGALIREAYAKKGGLRVVVGVISAATDLFLAGAVAAERLSKDLPVWKNFSAKLGDKAFSTSSRLLERSLPSLARALPKVVTKRLLGGIISGGLAITVSILDMTHEWDTGDHDSALAYGASAVGGGMMVMGGLMMANLSQSGLAPILLGLGPWGWVVAGAALAVGAGVMAVMLDDPPLVDWLQRGPFGDEQDNAYPHLADDPKETYYRLVGLLAQPRITIEKAHNMEARLAGMGYVTNLRDTSVYSKINTVVRVENNLAGMLDEPRMTVDTRVIRVTRKPTRRGLRTQREILPGAAEVILEQPLPNGKAFYLALPPRETFKVWQGGEGVRTSEVAVRAQWHAGWAYNNSSHSLVFPAPELHKNPTFDAAIHGKPDFTTVNQPFWADEQTHKAEDTA